MVSSPFTLPSPSSVAASITAAPLPSGASLSVLRSVTRVTLSECFLAVAWCGRWHITSLNISLKRVDMRLYRMGLTAELRYKKTPEMTCTYSKISLWLSVQSLVRHHMRRSVWNGAQQIPKTTTKTTDKQQQRERDMSVKELNSLMPTLIAFNQLYWLSGGFVSLEQYAFIFPEHSAFDLFLHTRLKRKPYCLEVSFT